MSEEMRFAKGVVFRKEPAGGILFNIDTGDLQVIEGVAFGICDMIDRGSTRGGILSELENRYPDEDGLEEDLECFLDQLTEKGLLE